MEISILLLHRSPGEADKAPTEMPRVFDLTVTQVILSSFTISSIATATHKPLDFQDSIFKELMITFVESGQYENAKDSATTFAARCQAA